VGQVLEALKAPKKMLGKSIRDHIEAVITFERYDGE
jgi:hypothetical protein